MMNVKDEEHTLVAMSTLRKLQRVVLDESGGLRKLKSCDKLWQSQASRIAVLLLTEELANDNCSRTAPDSDALRWRSGETQGNQGI